MKNTSSARFAKLHGRVFRSGLWTLAAALAALALAIAVNVLVSRLPQDILHIDTTSNSVYAFSPETEKLLSSLSEDVRMYCISSRDGADETVSELLSRYESKSARIHVQYIDPMLYPNFTNAYSDTALTQGSVIVESDRRATIVNYEDLYAYELNYDTYAYDSYFAGESVVTSAVDFVTNDDLPKVYVLTGHGELALGASFTSAIERQNIALVPLSLFALDSIPEDCQCLLLISPASDLTESEADAILAYLSSGGDMLLFTDYTETEMPNFDRVLSSYGVTRGKGLIIEGDESRYLSQYVHYLLPEIRSHAVTDPLLQGGYAVLAPVAEPIFTQADAREGLAYTALLTTSEASYRKTLTDYTLEDYSLSPDDMTGPFTIGLAVTEDLIGGGDVLDEAEDAQAHAEIPDAQQTRIVYFSTSYLLDPTVSAYVAGANEDLVKNALNWMTEREAAISISPKRISIEYLSMSAADSSIGLVLTIALPLAALAVGAVVLARRARRKA